jgi:hypothetical protein
MKGELKLSASQQSQISGTRQASSRPLPYINNRPNGVALVWYHIQTKSATPKDLPKVKLDFSFLVTSYLRIS